MTDASCRIVINAPADAIWRVISDFGAADQYLTGVVTCTLEGEGVGALRTLTNVDASIIVERLDLLDAAAWRLSYTLLTDTPFGDCRTTMAMRDLGPNIAELTWSTNFEAMGIPESEASALMEGALAENCLALKQYTEVVGWQ